MEQKTGHDLRTQLEKGREIARNFYGLFDDICKRPDIPTLFWRALIRNSANPRPIAEDTPVLKLIEVYAVNSAPLILFYGDEHLHIWHQGQMVNPSVLRYITYNIFVGKDGVVDWLKFSMDGESETDDAEYYHVLPAPNDNKPFRTTKNINALTDEFRESFLKAHGEAEPWGRNGPFYRRTFDYEIAENNGITGQCVSGPIGDLQIGIVRCGEKLYQVILGWAEDFKDLPK